MGRTWCTLHGNGLRIAVHVQPNASRTEVAGEVEGALKIRLAAPPVDGKANEALERFIAGKLDLPRRDVKVSHGHSSRQKLVEVRTGLGVEQAKALLGA